MPLILRNSKISLYLDMKRTIRLLGLTIITSLALTSCHNVKIGDGDIIEYQNYTDSTSTLHFSEIVVNADCNVYLTQNNLTIIRVSGYENLVPFVNANFENNKLTVELMEGVVFDNNNIKVYITTPLYTKVSLNSSASINAIDSINGNKLEVVNNGSGTISLFGNMNLVDSYAAGSGITRLCALEADTVNATMFGSGILSTKPVNRLNAQVPGSGQIQYVGNPTISFSITGSGSIMQTLGCY
jgi:hypothetical protein